MNRSRVSKGFTLAELLVVVAIIGVLVAIAIPVFGSALQSAQESTYSANFRSAYAEQLVFAMTHPNDATQTNPDPNAPEGAVYINYTVLKECCDDSNYGFGYNNATHTLNLIRVDGDVIILSIDVDDDVYFHSGSFDLEPPSGFETFGTT